MSEYEIAGKYHVVAWHGGEDFGYLTVEEILKLRFMHFKFNNRDKICWVTNCCSFKHH